MYTQHLVIIKLVLLLLFAVIIPVQTKGTYKRIKLMMVAVLGAITVLSILNYINVLKIGTFFYDFGNWNKFIGVQFRIDEFSSVFAIYISLLATLILIYSFKDIENLVSKKQSIQYYAIVLVMIFSVFGLIFTNDLFNMFVFMEILSITSCGIVSIVHTKKNLLSSFKYLMINTIGSLSILKGIAYIYMVSGHLNISKINESMEIIWEVSQTNIMIALGFIMIGVSIKVAAFPMHIWVPDAYESAPASSAAFLSALANKVYVVVIFKIIYNMIGRDILCELGLMDITMYFAAVGIVFGSLFAIAQKNIKRMLAYSSVAQVGYILLGLALNTPLGNKAALFHMVSHGLLKTALFMSVGAIFYQCNREKIKQLDGLASRSPVALAVFAIGAFGMIGIPGTSGFMGKLYLSIAVLQAGRPILLLVIIVSSFLSAMYFFPIIISAFVKEDIDQLKRQEDKKLPKILVYPMVIIILFSMIIGFYPQLITTLAENAMSSLMIN
ncbi:MAG: proton-conducting transporter membrane subunit [Alkaliphilus sp.]